MIRSLLHALRIGASVKNPTPLKWAGVAADFQTALSSILEMTPGVQCRLE